MKTQGIFILLLSAVFSFNAKAQTPRGGEVTNTSEQIGNTFAIIVGIADYKQLPKLQYSSADALALKNYLVKKQKLPAYRVSCFVNEEATSINIFDKLYTIADSLKSGDRFIFYFAGHGDWEAKLSDNALLLLPNAPTKNYLRYQDQFINCHTLNDILKKLTEKNVRTVLIADACHSGNLSGGTSGAETTNLQLKNGAKNDIRFLSCKPDELSFEDSTWGGGRGVFSYYLTLGLQGLTRKNTTQPFDLTVEELFDYIKVNVKRETGDKQTPSMFGDERTVLARVHPALITEKPVAATTPRTTPHTGRGVKDTTSAAFAKLVESFNEAISRNNLVEPRDHSAAYFYQQIESYGNVCDGYRNKLLAAMQSNFNTYADNFYNDKAYPKADLIQLRNEMQIASRLVANKPALYNQFASRKLFLDACLITYAAQHGMEESLRRSEIQQAADSLEAALKLNPYEPMIYRKLGECYAPIDKLKGVMYIKKYIELTPKDAGAWNLLGITYFHANELSSAIEALQEAIRLEPQVGKYYYNLANTYKKNGDTQMANRYFQKAQAVNQPKRNDNEN